MEGADSEVMEQPRRSSSNDEAEDAAAAAEDAAACDEDRNEEADNILCNSIPRRVHNDPSGFVSMKSLLCFIM